MRRRGPTHHDRGRDVDRRVLPEDGGLQVAKRPARMDAEVRVEDLPQPPEHRQRVALPPGPVQGEHQLAVDLLVQRVFMGEAVQLRDDLHVLARRQPGVDERSADARPELVQVPGLLVQPRQPGHVGQRSPPPEGDGGPQQGHPP